ncbi:DUF2290 domain-containing protein [Siphonobacter sp. SORGH_AS_0500]|uniref:DUF2290 domain-containing protein n=1 Tax=Siphonobacter sp. SORGH_AS_0500 TaxID=1864824 RepID=UPI00285B5E07|nr:DUF2290 domain-containing protein [Siphonobacter sp. SORGH_AS_0500]MDR6195894.1 hypothetical protein [Siphonobacter sp. SORGH_AS_0500]
MNIEAFSTSFRMSYKLIEDIGLLRQKGIKVLHKDDVSPEFKRISQKRDYFLTYKTAIKNFDYDFLLEDQSIFQFSYTCVEGAIFNFRYAFFQNPQEYVSYQDFLLSHDLINDFQTVEDVGAMFYSEYEQFLTEQQINTSSTSIRYDLDFKNYSPLIHSTSHIHIGNYNDIRIPCDKIITPYKFTLFVLKHCYYYKWKELISQDGMLSKIGLDTAKNSCTKLQERNWSSDEKYELFIT